MSCDFILVVRNDHQSAECLNMKNVLTSAAVRQLVRDIKHTQTSCKYTSDNAWLAHCKHTARHVYCVPAEIINVSPPDK